MTILFVYVIFDQESNFFLVISFIWKRYLCRSNYEIGISGNKLVDGYTDLFTMTSYSNSFVLYVFSWWWINKLDADGIDKAAVLSDTKIILTFIRITVKCIAEVFRQCPRMNP